MNFPETVFGRCPNCGGNGADYDDDDSAVSTADTVNSDTGNGILLVPFRGSFICEMCVNNIRNREQTEIEVELDDRDKDLRGRAGFRSSVPDSEDLDLDS